MRPLLPALLAALVLLSPAVAATEGPGDKPYAGLEARPIAGLSEEQRAGYLAGDGLGLALPAELNGYPGPAHVLELAAALSLTTGQEAAVTALVAEMRAGARALGAEIVAAEAALDALFAEGEAEPASLAALTARLGGLQGRLREWHLAYHLRTRALLEAEQIATYARLRGYEAQRHGTGGHGGHGGHARHGSD